VPDDSGTLLSEEMSGSRKGGTDSTAVTTKDDDTAAEDATVEKEDSISDINI